MYTSTVRCSASTIRHQWSLLVLHPWSLQFIRFQTCLDCSGLLLSRRCFAMLPGNLIVFIVFFCSLAAAIVWPPDKCLLKLIKASFSWSTASASSHHAGRHCCFWHTYCLHSLHLGSCEMRYSEQWAAPRPTCFLLDRVTSLLWVVCLAFVWFKHINSSCCLACFAVAAMTGKYPCEGHGVKYKGKKRGKIKKNVWMLCKKLISTLEKLGLIVGDSHGKVRS